MAIKPAGTYNLKAARLKGFIAWFLQRFDGDLERMKQVPPHKLREELLEVKG
ncbi:MAG: endonuclease, partial [Planctomycetes bacterium]|nr:endonuclease [Planctomycetota bacterium]